MTKRSGRVHDKKFRECLNSIKGLTDKNRDELEMEGLSLAFKISQLIDTVLFRMKDVCDHTEPNSKDQCDSMFKLYMIIRPYKAFFKKEILGNLAYDQLNTMEEYMVKTEMLQMKYEFKKQAEDNNITPSQTIPDRKR